MCCLSLCLCLFVCVCACVRVCAATKGGGQQGGHDREPADPEGGQPPGAGAVARHDRGGGARHDVGGRHRDGPLRRIRPPQPLPPEGGPGRHLQVWGGAGPGPDAEVRPPQGSESERDLRTLPLSVDQYDMDGNSVKIGLFWYSI